MSLPSAPDTRSGKVAISTQTGAIELISADENLLRITVELVGGVDRPPEATEGEFEKSPGRLAVRKGAGNVVELGSIFAFGFSPLWLLAAAADVTRGTRVYLDVLVDELAQVEDLRPVVDERQHDRAEGALERRVHEQLVQHDLGVRVLLELDHDPHALAVGLVAQVADPLHPPVLHQVRDLLEIGVGPIPF